MAVRRSEVADIFREHGRDFLARYGNSVSPHERRVLRDLTRCRTMALGGHKYRCESCDYEEISYNSCRNRHCPKCQASARAQWLEREATYLLDVEYFHVVFTLPADLAPLALRNKHAVYTALFRAAAETLQTIAADPKHLGARVGILMVLHTWGQAVHHHPHVHCVVPGGGLSLDGTRWVACRNGFFLPVRVLSRLFRGKFLALLERTYTEDKFSLTGRVAELQSSSVWKALLNSLRQKEWVVYSKRPFGGPKQVLKYLARYTHRVAISNRRIVSVADGKVRFRWKDYAHGAKQRVMKLEAVEFIRRFLLHVLPKGFVRIRHYGFLANGCRKEKLEVARKLLERQGQPAALEEQQDASEVEAVNCETLCPRCKEPRLFVVDEVAPTTPPWPNDFLDSS